MGKMKFPTRIKYNGQYFGALESFEVASDDIDRMVKLGGVIVKNASKSDGENDEEASNVIKNASKADGENDEEAPRKRKKKDSAGD